MYGILPEIEYFKDSFRYIPGSNLSYLLMAFFSTVATFFFATFNYYLLVKKPINFYRTLLVQFANGFVGKLLPAGIGGIGLLYIYFRNNKHTPSQAASVVTVNNLLGFLGHITFLLAIMALFRNQIDCINIFNTQSMNPFAYFALASGLIFLVLANTKLKDKFINGFKSFISNLLEYRHQKSKLIGALLSSISLTLFNVLSLYFVSKGLNLNLPFYEILIIYTISVGTGVATPTPGGLGGVEAGLVLGLIAYNVLAPQALAVVLVYRLISSWIPAVFGIGMLAYVERRGYLKLS